MHDAYEKAAVGAGWETQQASRKAWAEVPEANKVTMRAAVRALLEDVTGEVNATPVIRIGDKIVSPMKLLGAILDLDH